MLPESAKGQCPNILIIEAKFIVNSFREQKLSLILLNQLVSLKDSGVLGTVYCSFEGILFFFNDFLAYQQGGIAKRVASNAQIVTGSLRIVTI